VVALELELCPLLLVAELELWLFGMLLLVDGVAVL
jgi:hypothetical protein